MNKWKPVDTINSFVLARLPHLSEGWSKAGHFVTSSPVPVWGPLPQLYKCPVSVIAKVWLTPAVM